MSYIAALVGIDSSKNLHSNALTQSH